MDSSREMKKVMVNGADWELILHYLYADNIFLAVSGFIEFLF